MCDLDDGGLTACVPWRPKAAQWAADAWDLRRYPTSLRADDSSLCTPRAAKANTVATAVNMLMNGSRTLLLGASQCPVTHSVAIATCSACVLSLRWLVVQPESHACKML